MTGNQRASLCVQTCIPIHMHSLAECWYSILLMRQPKKKQKVPSMEPFPATSVWRSVATSFTVVCAEAKRRDFDGAGSSVVEFYSSSTINHQLHANVTAVTCRALILVHNAQQKNNYFHDIPLWRSLAYLKGIEETVDKASCITL